MVKLKAFVKKAGSQEAAARELGVSARTVQRWLNKGEKPLPIYAQMLKAKGVEV